METSTLPAFPDKTLTLPDGRTLAWIECGRPAGTPFFFFHGYPCSRLEAVPLHFVMERHGVRLISPDRPGFGLSSALPGRTLADWAADVEALAAHLGLARFAVLGQSGGGAYAVACAYKIAPEKLTGVGLFCSSGPWDSQEVKKVVHSPFLVSAFFYRHMPRASKLFFRAIFKLYKPLLSIDAVAAFGEKAQHSEDACLGVEVGTPSSRQRLRRQVLEAYRQSTDGIVDEGLLLFNTWDMPLEDIPFRRRIQLWHGQADWNVPVELARHLAGRLPCVDVHEYAALTHFTLVRKWDEAVRQLLEAVQAADVGEPGDESRPAGSESLRHRVKG